MACDLDDLIVGEVVVIANHASHTCENCGYTMDIYGLKARYTGIQIRSSVITHTFIKESLKVCQECGADISQLNAPCGGIPLYASVEQRVEQETW